MTQMLHHDPGQGTPCTWLRACAEVGRLSAAGSPAWACRQQRGWQRPGERGGCRAEGHSRPAAPAGQRGPGQGRTLPATTRRRGGRQQQGTCATRQRRNVNYVVLSMEGLRPAKAQ